MNTNDHIANRVYNEDRPGRQANLTPLVRAFVDCLSLGESLWEARKATVVVPNRRHRHHIAYCTERSE